ncbi:MAG: prolipoprotein diacylglyceryl transferase, partial [Candidatus Omnitrophica bacterium]|nr:prolipoprotein diacylglyceryl transferase [Candidatus Omnitrophota bacterium]
MKPIFFSLGQFHLYSFGVMVALGVIVALFLMFRRARGREFPQVNDIYDMVFITVTMGFVGARVSYVIQNLAWYLEHPFKIFALWEGGLIFYGGLAVAVFSLY